MSNDKINGARGAIHIGVPGVGPAVPSGLLGGRAARVRSRVLVRPHVIGRHGRAWLHNTAKVRELQPADQQDATVAYWIVEAPFAHPLWHSYAVVVVHLRDVPGLRPATRYLENGTHEIGVHAIHPDADREKMLFGPINPTAWLTPCNFAGQFVAAGDSDAFERVKGSVILICAGRLSPDTDHQRSWAQIYGDNMIAHRSRAAAAPLVLGTGDSSNEEK